MCSLIKTFFVTLTAWEEKTPVYFQGNTGKAGNRGPKGKRGKPGPPGPTISDPEPVSSRK